MFIPNCKSLMVIMFALAFAVLPCAARAQGNLLKNGDFEDGLSSWQTPSWFKKAIEPRIDTTENQGPGSGSLRFDGDKINMGYVMQQVAIKPGKQMFRLSGWMKTADFQNSWGARIQAQAISFVKGKEVYSPNYPLITPPHLHEISWCEFSLEFTPPETAQVIRVILLTQPPTFPAKPNNGKVWFDNIKLECITEPVSVEQVTHNAQKSY